MYTSLGGAGAAVEEHAREHLAPASEQSNTVNYARLFVLFILFVCLFGWLLVPQPGGDVLRAVARPPLRQAAPTVARLASVTLLVQTQHRQAVAVSI